MKLFKVLEAALKFVIMGHGEEFNEGMKDLAVQIFINLHVETPTCFYESTMTLYPIKKCQEGEFLCSRSIRCLYNLTN